MSKNSTEFDFSIHSQDKNSHITFELEEYVHNRQPSLSCTIDILDNHFKGWNIGVWFTLGDLCSFINELEGLQIKKQGEASLMAMSHEDFNITFKNFNNKGNIVISYSLSNIRYNSDISLRNTLTGGFQIDSEFFSIILGDFKKLASVSELEQDIDFT